MNKTNVCRKTKHSLRKWQEAALRRMALAAGCGMLLLLASCSSKGDPKMSRQRQEQEARAQTCLATARAQMRQGQAAKAKNTVISLREQCPMALTARAEGILLMDSIEMALTQQELRELSQADSVKAEEVAALQARLAFYKRKLEHDLQPESR